MSDTNPQIQEAQKTTSRFNAKKNKKTKPNKLNKKTPTPMPYACGISHANAEKNPERARGINPLTTEKQQKELHLNSPQNSPRQ